MPALTTIPGTPAQDAVSDDVRPRRQRTVSNSPADRVFRAVARLSGTLVLAIMALVGLFLLISAYPALKAAKWHFLTIQDWQPERNNFGVLAILVGTVLIGVTATLVSLPLALGTALFISEYAPKRIQPFLIGIVDLMAAVPSVVYGLWGFFFLQPIMVGVDKWISSTFSWFPLLSVPVADPQDPLANETVYTSSTFIAGLVVALMVTPIASSVMREAFMQAPSGEREGAYALGATKWGMIRAVVLPYGRGGIIGGTMLGLGRALGETIAVYMIISPVFHIQIHILQNGAISVSSLIALTYSEASEFGLSALFAAGLALYLMTLAVNFVAATIVSRSRSGSEA